MEVTRLRRNKAWQLGKVFHWPGYFISQRFYWILLHTSVKEVTQLRKKMDGKKTKKAKIKKFVFFLHGPWCFSSSSLKVLVSKQNAVILSLQTYFLFFELLQLVKVSQNFHFFCPDSLIYKRFFEDFFHLPRRPLHKGSSVDKYAISEQSNLPPEFAKISILLQVC